MRTEQDFETYLAHLRQLAFIKDAEIRKIEPGGPQHRPDAILWIQTPRGECEFFVEVKKTHMTYAIADGMTLHGDKASQKPWMLFALYIPRKIGRYLAEREVNYVDLPGNCRLKIGNDYIALIEGQRPVRVPAEGRGIGVPGYQVLFAILAKPELLNAPVRTLAEAAGVGKTTAAETLARLEKEGLIGTGQRLRRLLDGKRLLDRWLTGYEAVVRPHLLLGRFRTQDPSPAVIEERIERELPNTLTWAWGGGAAAMRITKRFRGEETVIHVANAAHNLAVRLRALPAVDGPLMILSAPGTVAFEGIVPRTVHPLLVFTELATSGNARARETALYIRERYLQL